jgi:hypothetical protein
MASIASCNSRRGHFAISPFGLMLKLRVSSDIATFYWLHDWSRQSENSENFQLWPIGRFPHRATDWDIQRATNDDGIWTRAFTPYAWAAADHQGFVISALSPIAY